MAPIGSAIAEATRDRDPGWRGWRWLAWEFGRA